MHRKVSDRWRMVLVLLAGLGAAAAGCGPADQETASRRILPAGPNETADVHRDDSSEPAAVPERSLAMGTWDDVTAFVEANRGRIVVVDIWSTSCLPCVRELPHLATLQKLDSERIACLAFDVDYTGSRERPPESFRDRVETVLEKVQACYPVILSVTPADEVFHRLELPSIPAVCVYGPDGRLVQRFDASLYDPDSDREEAFTYEDDIIPLVQNLLSRPPD